MKFLMAWLAAHPGAACRIERRDDGKVVGTVGYEDGVKTIFENDDSTALLRDIDNHYKSM